MCAIERHDGAPPFALVSGTSRGLGRAIASDLVAAGWDVIGVARSSGEGPAGVRQLCGDVVASDVVDELGQIVGDRGHLDLVVANAGVLGPGPSGSLLAASPADLLRCFEANVVAPIALLRVLRPHLASGSSIVAITSEMARRCDPGWGPYGASKAALEHLVATIGAEMPGVRAYALDPGGLRTEMMREAYPDDDLGDLPDPSLVAPAVRLLHEHALPGGRYTAAEVLGAVAS